MKWGFRVIGLLALSAVLLFAFTSLACATAADVYARSKCYRASTYSGHGALPGFGAPVDLNGCTSTGGYVEDSGWPICAPGPGSVAVYSAASGGGWGNSIIWTSKDGEEQLFMAHLSKFGAKGVVAGGAVIGYIGTTGRSDGPHIHAQRRYNGSPAALQLSGKTVVAGRTYASRGPDGVAPIGAMTAPVVASSIGATGICAIRGTFSDTFGVAKVNFYWRYYEDPSSAYRLIGSDTTAGSDGKTYGVAWAHSLPKTRRVVIKAIPYDKSGNRNCGITRSVWTTDPAPVAAADSYALLKGTSLSISLPGVLANDTDADGDMLSTVLLSDVSHGALSLDANGGLAYTPEADYLGSDSFTYKAYDGASYSPSATVSIAVRTAPAQTSLAGTSGTKTAGYYAPVPIYADLRDGVTPLSGKPVILESSPNGSVWTTATATVRQPVPGRYQASVKRATPIYLRFRFIGESAYAPVAGPVVKIYPKAYLTNPVAPTYTYRNRGFTTYGYLKPRHTAGSYPVRIYKYRYVSGVWKSYGYVTAKASNYSSYTKYIKALSLPYAGRWRLRTYAPADSGHVATWSSGYDYVTVK